MLPCPGRIETCFERDAGKEQVHRERVAKTVRVPAPHANYLEYFSEGTPPIPHERLRSHPTHIGIDPRCQIVIASMNDDDLLKSMCVEAGAAGYIGTDGKVWQLKKTIRHACGRIARAA